MVPSKSLIVVALLASYAGAQSLVIPNPVVNRNSANQPYLPTIDDEYEALGDLWMIHGERQGINSLEAPSDSVSKLDLKAPGQARREYEKGVLFLQQKKYDTAVERLNRSIVIYPKFVAAHNALGAAYLDLGKNEQARDEFAQAIALDDHLPASHLNLGRAQLALKNYSAAENAMQKASALEPLDLHLRIALSYAELLNHDYTSTIATADQVHNGNHKDAAIVHYFAAAAFQGQNNLPEMERELRTFLDEDPKSPIADNARQTIARIEDLRLHPPAPSVQVSYSVAPGEVAAPGALPAAARRVLQQMEEERQIREAEAACDACSAQPTGPVSPDMRADSAVSRVAPSYPGASPWILHSRVNEVALFFAATDHGQSVGDLTRKEVVLRDNGKPPAAVLSFLNEAELPLRLGLIIDTSGSITRQFSFEQNAAASFLREVVIGKSDLAFVVGFSSSVLLVQDLTSDQAKISHGIDQLAPAGGTALWDAVKFAADKLASKPEQHPVARILVVISDGNDNASSASLKQAIESAERGEVIIYAVGTGRYSGEEDLSTGARALKTLAEGTGGAAFFPTSLGGLNHRLADLQQVIRSRYLISYRPAEFKPDGHYRPIDISAEKSGHKLHIYARRGYYASAGTAD
jgi:Ca-activated chloride channel homolog